MTTTLYLLTVATWFHLHEFSNDLQLHQCDANKNRIEEQFNVEAVCVTRSDAVLIVNNITYRKQ